MRDDIITQADIDQEEALFAELFSQQAEEFKDIKTEFMKFGHVNADQVWRLIGVIERLSLRVFELEQRSSKLRSGVY
jgi:hypothetical protein